MQQTVSHVMNLLNATKQILDELKLVLDHITVADFKRPVPVLNGSTIGQHVRHILEFFICLNDGYPEKNVNYDCRRRDKSIEQDQAIAMEAVKKIFRDTHINNLNQEMTLEMTYDPDGEYSIRVATNYQRELAYNIEHAVHHMALIRIGVEAIAPYVHLPKDFGVAVSTVRHHASAQK
jgi:hypothetical protein